MSLPDIPLVQPGDDLAAIILDSLKSAQLELQAGDVLVITSKIVSKAENRYVRLDSVEPGAEAQQLAAEVGKDPRMVELVLQESQGISRKAPGVLVTAHRLGFVSANAGIDHSNTGGDEEVVLLMPLDPEATAHSLRQRLLDATGAEVGIVISDSHGRPFRLGTIGIAIAVAGLPALLDLRGKTDLFGRELRISMQGYADMIASAAQLIGGEAAEGRPVTLVRGLQHPAHMGSVRDLLRPVDQDLYR